MTAGVREDMQASGVPWRHRCAASPEGTEERQIGQSSWISRTGDLKDPPARGGRVDPGVGQFAAPPAQAADINVASLPNCTPATGRFGARDFRNALLGNGYGNIRITGFHRKLFPIGLPNVRRCGFFRATARKNGQNFAIYYSWAGQNLGRRQIAATTPTLTPGQAQLLVQRRGFTGVRILGQVRQGGRLVYVAEGRRGPDLFKIGVAAATGRMVTRRILRPIEIRAALQRAGFRNISNIKRPLRGLNTTYIAEAERGGRRFSVPVGDTSGRIGTPRPIASTALTPPQMQAVLRRNGFRNITRMARRRVGGQDVYIAQAERGGRKLAVMARASDGRVLRTRDLGPATPALTQAQMVRQMQRDGFRNIKNIRRGTLGGQPVWIVTATKGNRECQHQVDGRTGKVTRTGQCTAVGVTRFRVQQVLNRAGFTRVRNLRQLPNGNWTALASFRGRNGTVTVNGRTGRIANFTPGAAPALTQAQVVRQLQRDGFRNIKNIRRGTLGGQPVWIVTATKGNRECLHQVDGVPVR